MDELMVAWMVVQKAGCLDMSLVALLAEPRVAWKAEQTAGAMVAEKDAQRVDY
jgi:hypothetical protein